MIHALLAWWFAIGALPLLGVVNNIPRVVAGEAVSKAELANSERNLIRPVFNVKTDFGAKGDGLTNDQKALNEASAAAKAAVGGIVFCPKGTYLVGTSWSVGELVIILGAGAELTTIKAAANLNADVIKGEKIGENGQNFIEIERLGVDGNKAENAVAGNGINIDGQRCRYYRIKTHHCRESGIKHTHSGADIVPSQGGGDSYLVESTSYMNETNGVLIGAGAHDFRVERCQCVENKTNGLLQEATATQLVCEQVHNFGAAERMFNFNASASCYGCQAEGASVANVRIKAGVNWYGGRVFNVANNNVPGFEIVENSSRLLTRGVFIKETGTGGAFRAIGANSGSGSSLDFQLEGGESVAFAKEAGGSFSGNCVVMYMQLIGNCKPGEVPGPPETASAEELKPPAHPAVAHVKVTGGVEIKKIRANYAGQLLVLRFSATCKVINGENLKLAANFESTAAGTATLTLSCDGTNWYEVARKTP